MKYNALLLWEMIHGDYEPIIENLSYFDIS